MTAAKTFRCSLITPERRVLECEAAFVAFPAHDGEMGVLSHRAPLVCKLGIGILRIQTPQQQHTLFVDGGFAQVRENEVTLLTQQAKTREQIDASAAERSLDEARAMKVSDEASAAARGDAICRAKAQLKLVCR